LIRKKIDWCAAKTAYVTGSMSYAEIAERFGVSQQTVAQKAAKEKWRGERLDFRRRMINKAVDEKVASGADRLAVILDAAEGMAGVLAGVFEDDEQFHRYIVQDRCVGENGAADLVTLEKRFEKVDSRAIKNLTGALKDMTQVLRDLYRLPGQKDEHRQRMAEARLDMAQANLELARQRMGSLDSGSVQVEMGEAEAYAG